VPYLKGEKRLAVQVEDHPVSYINFEGNIPKGQYGGGTVMVWDRGTFTTEAKSPLQELAHGKLHFALKGKKLHGEWYLVQLRGSTQWLLIKGSQDMKPVSKKADDWSALSGKSMAQISAGDKVWRSKPREPKTAFKAKIHAAAIKKDQPRLKFVPPMKAELQSSPPVGDDWIYEIKFDGFRALVYANRDSVHLLSRSEKSFNDKFPEIAEAFRCLKLNDTILDGEIVALDSKGISSFQLLQAFELGQQRPAIYFYAFDLLRLRGKDLRAQTLIERKSKLEKLLADTSGLIRFSASLGDAAGPLLKQAQKLGLEGLIGKRKESIYEAGRRSGSWIKLKLHQEQEFVIGGFTDPAGTRKHFGALLLGFYEKEKLQFCGKVGTGFNGKLLQSLNVQFDHIASISCPFANLPEKHNGRYGAGITAAAMKHCHWLKPALVCQVKFSEWTRDAKLRQPVFLGMREDKDARVVVREHTA
jgi:bifunctional non-homologous end joining protein LigD